DLWEMPKKITGIVVDHIPRFTLGKLTIMRKKWLLYVENMIKEGNKSDYDHYLAIIKRFKADKLPLEFFISKHIVGETFNFESTNRSEMKPQYMNLYSPLFVKEFKKLIKDEKYIIIEEFYPKKSHETHNMEYQIEVNLSEES
ncbi:hypothetical protein J4G37_37220, partial [Microvirga sp. 3-52]|nr:hypothetical protein [Microvirga sp. 3-52]